MLMVRASDTYPENILEDSESFETRVECPHSAVVRDVNERLKSWLK